MENEMRSEITYLFLVELCRFPVQCLEECSCKDHWQKYRHETQQEYSARCATTLERFVRPWQTLQYNVNCPERVFSSLPRPENACCVYYDAENAIFQPWSVSEVEARRWSTHSTLGRNLITKFSPTRKPTGVEGDENVACNHFRFQRKKWSHFSHVICGSVSTYGLALIFFSLFVTIFSRVTNTARAKVAFSVTPCFFIALARRSENNNNIRFRFLWRYFSYKHNKSKGFIYCHTHTLSVCWLDAPKTKRRFRFIDAVACPTTVYIKSCWVLLLW